MTTPTPPVLDYEQERRLQARQATEYAKGLRATLPSFALKAPALPTPTYYPPPEQFPEFVVAGPDAPSYIRAKADSSDLVKAFENAGSHSIHIWGTHTLTKPVVILSDDTDIVFYRGARVNTADSTLPGILIAGSRTDVTPTIVGASLTKGTARLTYSGSDPALVPGDIVGITTTQPYGGTIAQRPGENFAGEMLRVLEVDVPGKTITFDEMFPDTYQVSGLKLYRYNMAKRARVQGGTIVAPGGDGHPVQTTTNRCRPFVMYACLAPLVTDVTVIGKYAREGVAFYECWHPVELRGHTSKINDAAGASGGYEAYGHRAMGCKRPIFSMCTAREGRHGFEINGGQSGYGYAPGTVRPIGTGGLVTDCTATQTWGAGAGDHPGSSDTVFHNFAAYNCSGALFVRGRRPRITGSLIYMGAHHNQGPYATNQGNDHCITIGEQLRDASGALRTNTHDGWSGTGLYIDVEITSDQEGVSGCTSHIVHSVHPLVDATVVLGGVLRPTGTGVNVVGDRIENVRVSVDGLNLASSYSGAGNGWAFRFDPAPQTPAATSGQYCQGLRLDVTARNLRTGGVYIASGTSELNDGEITVKTRGLHGSFVANSPLIVLAGQSQGIWRIRDTDARQFARVNAVSGRPKGLLWQGASIFSDGVKLADVPFLSTNQVRAPEATGLSSAVVAVGNRNTLFLYKVRGCGQTFSAGTVGVTAIGSVGTDGSGIGVRVGAYLDDGTGAAPALGVAPIYDSGLIDLGATGNRRSGSAFTEPVGDYWIGTVLQYTTAPTTFPSLVALANPKLMSPEGLISTGTSVNQARCWSSPGQTGALVALATIALDQSARTAPGLVI